MSVVFLTGGTGFVGRAVLEALLADARVEQVIALVRARDEEHAVERLGPLRRVRAIAGSLEGVVIPREVTHVVHAAAHTSFRSVRLSQQTNVEGTRSLVRAAESLPRLQRFLFVGTAYRVGVVDVAVVEEDLPASERHVVEYTRTKAAAEDELRGPFVIARPSIVIGHTRLGVQPSSSLFWYYRAMALAGVSVFSDERRRDVVPVDWVADALVHLLLAPALKHVRYHLSAGERSCTWGEIRACFGARRSELITEVEGHPAWSAAGFDAETVSAIAAVAKFAPLPYVFANARVLGEGVAAPPPFTSWLPRCIETSRGSVREQARDDAG